MCLNQKEHIKIILSINNMGLGVQWVKARFSSKHEDMSSNPQNLIEGRLSTRDNKPCSPMGRRDVETGEWRLMGQLACSKIQKSKGKDLPPGRWKARTNTEVVPDLYTRAMVCTHCIRTKKFAHIHLYTVYIHLHTHISDSMNTYMALLNIIIMLSD